MAINKKAKGNRIELLAKKRLMANGWLVDSKPNVRFQSPDLFGQFDLIAIKGGEVKLIQIKSNVSHFYSARKELKEWKEEYKIRLTCEVWLYLGGRDEHKWRIDNGVEDWME